MRIRDVDGVRIFQVWSTEEYRRASELKAFCELLDVSLGPATQVVRKHEYRAATGTALVSRRVTHVPEVPRSSRPLDGLDELLPSA